MKCNYRPAVVVLFSSLWAWAGPGQKFVNTATDSKESPFIQRMIVTSNDKNLVVRFEGDLNVGRKMNVVQGNTGTKFHHADNQLIVTLNNENLNDFGLMVASDKAGKPALTPANSGTFKLDGQAVVMEIPLKLIGNTPVEIVAEIQALYYANEKDMVATQGRNLFAGPGEKPAVVTIAALPVKPEQPSVANLRLTETGADSFSCQWETNLRTDIQAKLQTAGEGDRVVSQPLRLKEHRLTMVDLRPSTDYVLTVKGTDFANRTSPPVTLKIRTTAPATAMGKTENAWLRVKGKYIVDSKGKPFPLGAYSHFVGEYWFNEFPRYGTLALTARYFKNMGLNACRLGLFDNLPNHWSASVLRDKSGFEQFGGAEGYVKKFVRPLADQIMNEGVYVILDWHWTYSMTDQDIEKIGKFWEAAANEFKDEPRVAIYQLLNEPCFKDGQNRPDLAERIRKITKDYIQRIRKIDQRHIILVSDWNCGWGWATESQWSPVNFKPGDPVNQIVYSKHISKEHCTDAFMLGGVDGVADRWDVPIMFDEVENGGLMGPKETAWFYNYLAHNPRKFGFATWVCGQYWREFPQITAAFGQSFLPKPPFGYSPEPVITATWWIEKYSTSTENKKTVGRFKMPKRLPAGDYGIVVPSVSGCEMALAPKAGAARMIGVWLGAPGAATWRGIPYCVEFESAVPNALYFHALEPFEEVVLRNAKPMPELKGIQLFRLNPKHQMPIPSVPSREVQF
jgi:hypothetical protein